MALLGINPFIQNTSVGGAASAGLANPTSPAQTAGYYQSISGRTPATVARGNVPGATAGAYYDPNQINHPLGAGGGANPLFDPGQTGRYAAYLNRLPVGQAGAGTDPALIAAIQRQLAGGTNTTNKYMGKGNDQSNAARAAMVGAIGGLQTAGVPAAHAQAAILAKAQADAAAASQTQQGLANNALTAGAGYRTGQQNLVNMLTSAANGGGPSAAQAQLQSGLDQSIAAQHALAAGVRGQGAGAAMLNATRQGEDMGLKNAATAAALRAQEQQNARDALGNVLATGRAQDLGNVTGAADIVNSMRGQDTNAAQVGGNIAGTTRAQDIGQAGQVVDAFGNVRTGDINAGVGLGGAQNTNIGLNIANAGQGITEGLNLNNQRLQGLGLDIQSLLGGGALMAGNDTNFRAQQLGKEAQDQALVNSIISGIFSAGGSVGAGLARSG